MSNDLAASALLFGSLKDERVSKKDRWLEVCSNNLQKLISSGNYEFLGRLVKQITMKIILFLTACKATFIAVLLFSSLETKDSRVLGAIGASPFSYVFTSKKDSGF